MSLLHIDGWDYLPAAPASMAALITLVEANGYFVENLASQSKGLGIHVTTGRFGFGNCLRFAGFPVDGNSKIVKPIEKITVNPDELVWGQAIYVGADHDAYFGFTVYDAITDTPQFSVTICEYGIVRVYRGYPFDGVLIGWSRAGAFYNSEWLYIDFKAKVHDTSGYVQVRINTKIVIDLVDVDTKAGSSAGFDSIAYTGHGATGETYNVYLDDGYLSDLAGAVNNDFLGNVRVKTQFTAGAGSLTDFIPSGANPNWQTAQNRLLTDGGGYNYAPNVGDADFYTIQAIINASVVHAVQVKSACRQDDATQRILHNRIQTNAVIGEGSDHYLNQGYTFYNDIFELNPDTGVGWTGAEVNLLEIGPEVQA